MNLVILHGNLGADPEVRQAGSTSVCNARMVTNERYKAKDGEWKEKAEWHNLEIWGKRGEAFAQYLQKGSGVIITDGSLSTRKWQDKDGNDRWRTSVKVNEWEFAGGKKGNGETHNADPNQARVNKPEEPNLDPGFDDEIPF